MTSDFTRQQVAKSYTEISLRLDLAEKAYNDIEKDLKQVDKRLDSIENLLNQDRNILRGIGIATSLILGILAAFFPMYLTLEIQKGIEKELHKQTPIQPTTIPPKSEKKGGKENAYNQS